MRGTGHTLSRLPAVRALARWALMCGAAVLVVVAAPKAYGQANALPEETAMAVPRPFFPGGVVPRAAGLPAVLAPSDAARLRRLFALQANGQIAAAIRETAALDPEEPAVEGVVGHLLADRHLGPHTRTAGAELRAWLARWPDLPDAPAIHDLLSRRLGAGQTLPPAPPRQARLPHAPEPDAAAEEEAEPQASLPARLPHFDQAVRDAARAGPPGAAARALRGVGPLAPGYVALLRGEAAQILFARNRDREALDLAAPGAADAALAGHWAGLAAWRLGRTEQAAALFQAAWNAAIATPAQRAAAAFWAARAHLRAEDPARHALWLSFAAQEPRSFHGLIARRMLGLPVEDGALPRETLGEADLAAVAAHPGGLRALALIQIGQRDRAEAELRQLWPAAAAAPGLGRALMLVADQAGLDSLAVQLADLLEATDDRPRSQSRVPVPRLRPAGGFTADPALVFAIARIESNFDPSLVSRAGARGLMQLMPGTARFLAGIPAGTEDEPAPLPALHDPAVNLSLGQRYLNFLATTEAVGGDKLRLLAAYNAGPGAMARWAAAIRDQGDPLLFLEAIPIDETRRFIPRVLTHTWLYAARMRLPAPSLDELAAGQWPRYVLPDRTAQH